MAVAQHLAGTSPTRQDSRTYANGGWDALDLLVTALDGERSGQRRESDDHSAPSVRMACDTPDGASLEVMSSVSRRN